jgi:diguanylate cyclase (GGDEF)-like protein
LSILIIDDKQESRLLIKGMLESGKYSDFKMVESAKEAINFLNIENADSNGLKVDLIIMDLIMPEMDGITACQIIKTMPQCQDVPIVIVSSDDEMKSLEASFEAGAVDFIHKPINRIELLARVRSVLKLKQEMDERKAREEELLYINQQLEKSNEILKQNSIIDGLTGIFNRRHFDDMQRREWQRALRDANPISLIIIDIDYFKGFNDTYGHQMGDECLKKIAEALAGTVKRPGDLVARYGGEEFSAILPDTLLDGAVHVANKMQMNVARSNIPYPESRVSDRVTISLGVASIIPDPIKSFTLISSRYSQLKSFIESADQALYLAKKSGRNQIKCDVEIQFSLK